MTTTPATLSRSNSAENLSNQGTFVTLEPLKLEFKHGGEKYRITFIKQRFGEDGEEKNLDLEQLTVDEIQAFVEQATKIMDVMGGLSGKPAGLMNSHSMTIRFTHTPDSPPSITERTLGRIFKDKLGWKEQEMLLEKISYKESEASEEKTFVVKLDTYDEDSQKVILATTRTLKRAFHHAFTRRQNNLQPNKLIKTQPTVNNTPPQQNPAVEPEIALKRKDTQTST